MALAVNRPGVIFKKCDLSNHKPDTNKNCAAGTCQHTCDKPDATSQMRQARCDSQTRAHPPGTLRYRVNGAQATSPRQAETPYEAMKDRPRNAAGPDGCRRRTDRH